MQAIKRKGVCETGGETSPKTLLIAKGLRSIEMNQRGKKKQSILGKQHEHFFVLLL